MANLFDMRFIVNTGKGGVGKTTLSVAMAQAFARRGKRVLIMQMNVPDKLGPLYGRAPIHGDVPVLLDRNIWVVNPTPQEAMREYALMILRFRTLYKAAFENRLVSRFLRMMPGLPELVMLGKAYYHEKELEGSKPRWDVVILDAPATGHGMFLLQIPQVITESIAGGLMADEARKMGALLRDKTRTMLNIITLAEELPINESVELKARLDRDVGIQVGYVVANHIYPRVFNDAEGRQLQTLLDEEGGGRTGLGAMLAAGVFRYRRRALQDHYLARARKELALPVVEAPFIFEAELKPEHIVTIADALTRAVQAKGAAR